MTIQDNHVSVQVEAPTVRPRRTRRTANLRRMVQETILTPADFIYPLFIRHGKDEKKAIASMPGQYQITIDKLASEVKTIEQLGIPAVVLFGIPEHKDACGTENSNPDGLMANAIREIKNATPDLVVVTDMCFCEYTDHGHCGIINTPDDTDHYNPNLPHGYLLNDPTLELLGQASVVHAQAGADIIAPSGMIDGMVSTIRSALDENGCEHVSVMSYAAKFASAFYGPFRDAAESPPSFGNRHQYQMNPGNRREAAYEVAQDVAQGADMLMVKPAMAYLDVLADMQREYNLPLAAYQVSGEFSMIHAAAANGWLDLQQTALESLIGIKRAGADMIINYFAKDACQWLGA